MENKLNVDPRARAIWARTRLHIWPERYCLASLPVELLGRAAGLLAQRESVFAALLLERDEVSLTIEESAWQGSSLRDLARGVGGPYRAVTFDINIEPDVCGYLAPAATLLAREGISIVPQCGFLKDHLLIRQEDVAASVEILERFIEDCREGN